MLRFVPSAADGLASVSEVTVFSDRLELLSNGRCVTITFMNIAKWVHHRWYYRTIARLGFGIRGWPLVADRDWFHPPSGRFFRFYTEPTITLYMPDEPRDLGYDETIFRRVQNVIALGGYSTFDLG